MTATVGTIGSGVVTAPVQVKRVAMGSRSGPAFMTLGPTMAALWVARRFMRNTEISLEVKAILFVAFGGAALLMYTVLRQRGTKEQLVTQTRPGSISFDGDSLSFRAGGESFGLSWSEVKSYAHDRATVTVRGRGRAYDLTFADRQALGAFGRQLKRHGVKEKH